MQGTGGGRNFSRDLDFEILEREVYWSYLYRITAQEMINFVFFELGFHE